MLDFDMTDEDRLILSRVTARCKEEGMHDLLGIEMDLNAIHSNGCPLDFQVLFDFDLGNFNHDIGGIRAHIDRETGKLINCFSPRCSKK